MTRNLPKSIWGSDVWMAHPLASSNGLRDVVFFAMFFVSAFLIVSMMLRGVPTAGPVGPVRGSPISEVVPLVTAVVGLFGTIATVALGWRADRRANKESELKTIHLEHLEQQIAEL